MIAAAKLNQRANALLTDEAMQFVTGGTATHYIDDRDTITDNSINQQRSSGASSVSSLHNRGPASGKR